MSKADEKNWIRADICQYGDEKRFQAFKDVLANRRAVLLKTNWAIGVDMWELEIANQVLRVFSDTWKTDIHGPPELVNAIIAEVDGLCGGERE
jgi:hypothetical protein